MKKQSQVVTNTIERAVTMLTATGCEFLVISPDGTQYGELEATPQQETKSRRKLRDGREYGELAAHYSPYLRLDAAVGDVLEIPVGEYKPEAVRASVAARLSNVWGPGAHTSAVVGDRVEILRIA